MKFGLAIMYWSLGQFPISGIALALMWATNKLYDWHVGFIAMPIRIIILFTQIGVLLSCLCTAVGIVVVLFLNFRNASRGKDEDGGVLSTKRYFSLLIFPAGMAISSILIILFNDWLKFNENGLGLISVGFLALDWVLEIGSLVIIGVWFVILPIFLHRRNALQKNKYF